jgi:hypothetical protein
MALEPTANYLDGVLLRLVRSQVLRVRLRFDVGLRHPLPPPSLQGSTRCIAEGLALVTHTYRPDAPIVDTVQQEGRKK